jgi:plastocyanin
MRYLRRSACCLCLTLPLALAAAELSVQVDDARGRPAPDAVITVIPEADQAGPGARQPAATRIIDQRDETFIPYVEVFRPGDSVVFRNSDHTRHHAYSFAPAKSFEFVLGPGERSNPLVLERPGVVAVGCNIHDRMITYLFVSTAPWIAKTGADGHARITELPPGPYTLKVWHPQLRPGTAGFTQALSLADAQEARTVEAALSLIPDPRLQLDREKARY